jgi:hypothetical protein
MTPLAPMRTFVRTHRYLDFDAIEPAGALSAMQALLHNRPSLGAGLEAQAQWR